MKKGLTLNRNKCKFFQSSVEFFGSIFSEHGVSPDPKKVKSVRDAPRPTDKRQVKYILGMANYVQIYIPGLASLVKPIRELTRKNSLFEWTSECEDAWLKLKDSLTSDTVMSYFNHKLETELVVDASPHGVGAILTQIQPTDDGRRDVQIVAYASRALDDLESRYSQTEREALTVRWGVEHFHLYLYGIKFTVVTDHNALVSIFSNVVAKPSPRIERWCLRPQQYTFNTVYRPALIIQLITCRVTQSHLQVSVAGRSQKNISTTELSVIENGIMLRGHRIVIPVTMRRKVVQIANEGTPVLSKTKDNKVISTLDTNNVSAELDTRVRNVNNIREERVLNKRVHTPHHRGVILNPIVTMFTTIRDRSCRKEIHRRLIKNWAALSPGLDPVLFVPSTE
ncbi:hypothetical protein LSH36_1289g00082 [Paralvinella palmiformis]|uniref:Reverse transcriptase/retrotransposon-derived protein RNase H-like domain-containing protein n=1 Tax=Paralvinella palmiformis TaxID=53620 RepID=A0AAD9MPI6_9ANNE|nr:hypothetical protein LSH36_1289g00082 [Paralvinella palmiformis]